MSPPLPEPISAPCQWTGTMVRVIGTRVRVIGTRVRVIGTRVRVIGEQVLGYDHC